MTLYTYFHVSEKPSCCKIGINLGFSCAQTLIHGRHNIDTNNLGQMTTAFLRSKRKACQTSFWLRLTLIAQVNNTTYGYTTFMKWVEIIQPLYTYFHVSEKQSCYRIGINLRFSYAQSLIHGRQKNLHKQSGTNDYYSISRTQDLYPYTLVRKLEAFHFISYDFNTQRSSIRDVLYIETMAIREPRVTQLLRMEVKYIRFGLWCGQLELQRTCW